MVGVLAEPGLLPGKFPEFALSRLGASLLKAAPATRESVSDTFDIGSGVAIRRRRNSERVTGAVFLAGGNLLVDSDTKILGVDRLRVLRNMVGRDYGPRFSGSRALPVRSSRPGVPDDLLHILA